MVRKVIQASTEQYAFMKRQIPTCLLLNVGTMQSQAGAATQAEEEENEEELSSASDGTFDYLLSMPIYSLTLEKVGN